MPIEELPVEGQIRRIFGKDADMAIRVSWAENGRRTCDRVHVNRDGSKDIGIFQINDKYHGHKGNLYNCTENIKVAYRIYKEQGNWSAWVAYNNGSYKNYE